MEEGGKKAFCPHPAAFPAEGVGGCILSAGLLPGRLAEWLVGWLFLGQTCWRVDSLAAFEHAQTIRALACGTKHADLRPETSDHGSQTTDQGNPRSLPHSRVEGAMSHNAASAPPHPSAARKAIGIILESVPPQMNLRLEDAHVCTWKLWCDRGVLEVKEQNGQEVDRAR